MNIIERIKLVKAMEFIARQVNDENVFERWLIGGVSDGDVEYGDLDVKRDDMRKWGLGYYTDDESFADLMGLFLRVMLGAAKSGGLYCDGILDARTESTEQNSK